MNIIMMKEVMIVANVNVNIRMDNDLKEQFEAFCSDVGMTMSTAINIFVKKTVREYRIPTGAPGLSHSDTPLNKK